MEVTLIGINSVEESSQANSVLCNILYHFIYVLDITSA